MPYFNITSPNDAYQLGYALGVNQCNCPLTQTETQYQFVDNFSKTVGKHTFKFGADLRYAQNLRVPSDSHRAGELTFNGGPTRAMCCSDRPEPDAGHRPGDVSAGRCDQLPPLRQHQHQCPGAASRACSGTDRTNGVRPRN